MKKLIFALLLILGVVPTGRAQVPFSSVTMICNSSGGAGSTSPQTCSTSLSVGDIVSVVLRTNQITADGGISDNHSNVYTEDTNCGVVGNIRVRIWHAVMTTTGVTITATFTGTSNGINFFVYSFSGGASPALDQAACSTFNANHSTQTLPALNLLNHDGVTSAIVCASGNVGTGEFAPVSPLLSITGENGGATSSYRGGHILDFTPGGASQTIAYTSAQGCDFTTFTGLYAWATYTSGTGTGGGPKSWIGAMMMEYFFKPFYRIPLYQIPFNGPRKIMR